MNTKLRVFTSLLSVACFLSSSYHSADASTEPLITPKNLVYEGAFRIPIGDFGAPLYSGGFSYGGGVVAYNPANNSLFMSGNIQRKLVGEISIPIVKIPNSTTDLSNLNYAKVLQNFSDITEGNRTNVGLNGASVTGTEVYIGGLLNYGDKLIGTAFTFYDGSGQAKLSHFKTGLNLGATGDFGGMYAVGTTGASYVSGWMTKVPSSLQASLGGPVLTGNGALSIISRTSYGPSAFAFDPSRLGVDNPVEATPLLYYPSTNATLGPEYGNTSPLFNGTTKIAGITMVNGSRSVLFIGYHGIGPYNYGQWAADPVFADTCRAPDDCVTGPKGWPVCVDPEKCITGRKGLPYDTDPRCTGAGSDGCYYDPTGMGAKGPHAYPYIYQVWAYDANDLASVKSGAKKPWEVMPYATWALPFPVAPTHLFGGATAYDPASGRIFIVQPQGDAPDKYNKMPVVHVFKIDLTSLSLDQALSKIGVKAMLLNGTVVLNNNADELAMTAKDRNTISDSTFPTQLANGATYNITIAKQPDGQNCTVINGKGTVKSNADVANIVLTCTNLPVATPKAPQNLKGIIVK